MIAYDQKLERRAIREVVLPHETGGDPISTGELFNPALSPTAALFRL
jgi:hypothetical protein